MTVAATVATGDLGFIRSLRSLLRTILEDMAKLPAVQAEWNLAVDSFASIIQTRENLIPALGPTLEFAGSIGFLTESVRDRVLLPDVSLKIHVCEDIRRGPFGRNKPKCDVLLDQCLLKIAISDIAIEGLDILPNGFLGIIDIPLGGSLLDFLPCFIGSDSSNAFPVDHTGFLAVLSQVS